MRARALYPIPWTVSDPYGRAFLALAVMFSGIASAEAAPEILTEQRVRDLVREALSAKQVEIDALKRRVRQLEAVVQAQQQPIARAAPEARAVPEPAQPAVAGRSEQPPQQPIRQLADQESGVSAALSAMRGEIEKLKSAGQPHGLKLTGFLDITGQAPSDEGKPFKFNSLEVDLEYHYGEHISTSAALVWDSSGAKVSTGIVDYHWFDDQVPARGRIFLEPGFHLQAGRFDLPFALDYQYFAAPDRPNVTPPLTTARIQSGGFNSDGVRIYGKWGVLDYAAYWTDALFQDRGQVIGGRVGLALGRNPYRIHRFGAPRTADLNVKIRRRRSFSPSPARLIKIGGRGRGEGTGPD